MAGAGWAQTRLAWVSPGYQNHRVTKDCSPPKYSLNNVITYHVVGRSSENLECVSFISDLQLVTCEGLSSGAH